VQFYVIVGAIIIYAGRRCVPLQLKQCIYYICIRVCVCVC